MPIEAVIFDLDDTLIDWWGSIDICLRSMTDDSTADALLAHCQAELWHRDPTGSFIWHRNTWALHHRRHDEWPAALPDMDPDHRQRLMDRFDQELWVDLFGETATTLSSLVGVAQLAILSNNYLVADEVARLDLGRWFDIALSATAPTHKPHPEAFRPVVDAVGVPANRCLYVGDSVKADVYGSLSAGLIPVWVDRWNDAWADRPDHIHRIESLDQLPALIASL